MRTTIDEDEDRKVLILNPIERDERLKNCQTKSCFAEESLGVNKNVTSITKPQHTLAILIYFVLFVVLSHKRKRHYILPMDVYLADTFPTKKTLANLSKANQALCSPVLNYLHLTIFILYKPNAMAGICHSEKMFRATM